MADERGAGPADRLADVLDKVDRVMAEAAELRREITRQLAEQRGRHQQTLSPLRRKAASKKR